MCEEVENRIAVKRADGFPSSRRSPTDLSSAVPSVPGGGSRLTASRSAARKHVLSGIVTVVAIALVVGCGNSKSAVIVGNPNGVASLPTEPAPGPVNTYVGAQGPGAWTLTLDDTSSNYSYQPTTFPNPPNLATTGSFVGSHGFLDLGNRGGGSLGYILEVPGRMAMLRAGDTTAPLVIGVPQTSCYSIPYRLRFEYVVIEAGDAFSIGGNPSSPGAYGSFVVNTDASGASWQFQDLAGNAPVGAAGFGGTCGSANGNATIGLSGEGFFNQYNNGDTQFNRGLTPTTTFQMGPSGIFIADQSDATVRDNGGEFKGSSSVGVAQPVAPLSTTDVAAKSYLGFLTEAPQSALQVARFTAPIAFGQIASSGTTMTGGIFPNDDLTQPASSDISVNFGKQDSKVYGLYSSASVTVPDPRQACAVLLSVNPSLKITVGIDANGFPTCTFPAVAVVGNPDGRYAIFLDSFNYSLSQVGVPMQIYLYQQ